MIINKKSITITFEYFLLICYVLFLVVSIVSIHDANKEKIDVGNMKPTELANRYSAERYDFEWRKISANGDYLYAYPRQGDPFDDYTWYNVSSRDSDGNYFIFISYDYEQYKEMLKLHGYVDIEKQDKFHQIRVSLHQKDSYITFTSSAFDVNSNIYLCDADEELIGSIRYQGGTYVSDLNIEEITGKSLEYIVSSIRDKQKLYLEALKQMQDNEIEKIQDKNIFRIKRLCVIALIILLVFFIKYIINKKNKEHSMDMAMKNYQREKMR